MLRMDCVLKDIHSHAITRIDKRRAQYVMYPNGASFMAVVKELAMTSLFATHVIVTLDI